MTPQEFKAWFDGFTENCDGPPNEKQWDRIKAKVADINGTPVSYPVYVDRHWSRPYPYFYSVTPNYSGGALCVTNTAGLQQASNMGAPNADNSQFGNLGQRSASNNFDSTAAMYAAGRVDADQIN